MNAIQYLSSQTSDNTIFMRRSAEFQYQTLFLDPKMKKKTIFRSPPPFPISHFRKGYEHESQLISMIQQSQNQMSGFGAFPDTQ